MMLPGIAFGVIDVLAPLRLARLGASGTQIAVTFLFAAAVEGALSPLAGRLTDRLGAARPVTISLVAGTAFGILACLLTLGGVLLRHRPRPMGARRQEPATGRHPR